MKNDGMKHAVRWVDAMAVEDICTLVNQNTGATGDVSSSYEIANDGTVVVDPLYKTVDGVL